MNTPRESKDDSTPLTDKEKREAYSVYVAIIGGIVIVVSFIWHIVSSLISGGEP